MNKTAVFVCRASSKVGLGHLSRCSALSSRLIQDGWRTVLTGQIDFLPSFLASGFSEIARYIGITPHNFDALVKSIRQESPSLLVVDDKENDRPLRRRLTDIDILTLSSVTGLGQDNEPYDVVWNFQLGTSPEQYPNAKHRLLGVRYFPLRSSLLESRRARPPQVEKLLITLGGADLWQKSRLIRELVGQIDSTVKIRVSPTQPQAGVNSIEDIAGELAWADAVICGGGLTKYEAVAVGIPSAVLNQTETEREDSRLFLESGLVFGLGDAWSIEDDFLRTRLSEFIRSSKLRSSLENSCIALDLTDGTTRLADAVSVFIADSQP